MSDDFVELVEKSAEARGDLAIPRDFIVEAIERVVRGGEEVEQYEEGSKESPTVEAVYKLAKQLYKESAGTKEKPAS